MKGRELTVIIPFRNEGIEVCNTIKSIKETSDLDFNIILINDGSDDGFDYKSISEEFQTDYLEHLTGIGVAASRNEGVLHCKTEYFLLLDAHMRAYTANWTSLIIQELRKDKNAIFCCQTVSIDKNGIMINEKAKGYGAHIIVKKKYFAN